ncbi:pyruvate formate lyase family protein, partial [Thermodesulfobacteriota bacterium]
MTTKERPKPGDGQPEMTRGQRLWSRTRDRRDTADYSLERAKLLTDSWKETEGLPIPIRRAKAFEKIITEIPIFIDEGQLLVGDWGTSIDLEHVEMRPEFTVDDIERGFKEGWLEHRFSQEDQVALKEIYEYWKDKSLMQSFLKYLDYHGEEKVKQLTDLSERNDYCFVVFAEFTDRSWYSPDWEKAIKKGLSGILVEVEEELQATRPLDDTSRDKKYFLQGLAIGLRAGMKFGKRYAALAKELAKSAKGERKAELEKIAEICDWVPENPARTFHEALQTMWFCDCFLYWDTGSHMRAAPGRVDQYFFPYYQRDIDEGRLTDEEVIELLECFRVKCSGPRLTVSKYEDSVDRIWTGDPMFINCTLGGQTPDGQDAVNRLSYLWLEAAMRVRTPHPTLSIRYHANLSPDFAMKAAELNSLGLGYPAWFGDKGNIEYLLSMTDATLDEARDYRPVGCLLPDPPHKVPGKWPAVMNMAKVLEITLNNGVDPKSGTRHGLTIGDIEDFKTFEELYEAYKKQLTYF